MKHAFAKALVVVLMIAVIAPFTPVSVPRAHAIDAEITLDIPRIAEAVLHTAAIVAAQTAIQSITHSIVNWINSGFHGSPGFATNLGVNIQSIADGAALQFINQLQKDASISSPFLAQTINAARIAYLLSTSPDALRQRLQYDLDKYAQNAPAFRAGQFNQGGFTGWMAMTFQCGNDPYCAQFAAQEALNKAVDSAVSDTMTQLGWGNGFFSWSTCPDDTPSSSGLSKTAPAGAPPAKLSNTTDKSKCTVHTPGSVVGDYVTSVTHEPQIGLAVATSIQQVIGALVGQLISGVLGPNGLLGGGGSNSSNNLRQALEAASSTNSGTSLGTSLSADFVQATQNERTNVALYQTDWQKVADAASRAVQTCTVSGNDASKESAQGVVAQSTAATSRSGAALRALDAVIAEATTAQTLTGTAQAAAVQQVNDDYNCLLSGGLPTNGTCAAAAQVAPLGAICPVSPQSLPSADELSCITTQSQDQSNPITLFTRMNQLAASCI